MRASTRERIRPARSPPRPPARRAPIARSAPGRDRARATRRVVFPAWPDVHTRERAAAPWGRGQSLPTGGRVGIRGVLDLAGDAHRALPAPRGRRARPSPSRGPDAPRRRRAGAPARPPAPRRGRGRLRGGRLRRLDHLPGREALRAGDRGAADARAPLRGGAARCRPQRGRAARRPGRVRGALHARLPHRDLLRRGHLRSAGLPLRAGGGGGVGDLRARDGDARLPVLRPRRAPRARRQSGAPLARPARAAGPCPLPRATRLDRPHRPGGRGAGHSAVAAQREGRSRLRSYARSTTYSSPWSRNSGAQPGRTPSSHVTSSGAVPHARTRPWWIPRRWCQAQTVMRGTRRAAARTRRARDTVARRRAVARDARAARGRGPRGRRLGTPYIWLREWERRLGENTPASRGAALRLEAPCPSSREAATPSPDRSTTGSPCRGRACRLPTSSFPWTAWRSRAENHR